MMKNNIFGKLLCGTLMLFAAMSFTACVDDNEDVGMPYLELDSETLPFALEGGHATFTVKTNRPWFITKDEASDWLTVEPMVGDGTAQVEILLPEATTGREATLTFNIANSYGVYLTKTMKIQQGEIKPAAVLWHENFGTPSQTSNAWPTVANYTGWEKGGLYGADVTYSAASDKAQIRGTSPNSVGYADASGAGKLFIGTGMPAFVVGNIQTDGATNYTLNFGGAYFNYAAKDETFYSDKCHIYVSGDNAKWSELTYTVAEAEEGWVYATAFFTLKEAADKLYIKLAVDEASCFSIDDMQLASGGAGGQEIDLAAGAEGEGGNEGGNEGEEPAPDAPDTTNAIWYETFGDPVKDGNNWPYANVYTGYVKQGSGVVAGVTTYNAQNTSVRSTSSQYSPLSGVGHVWFPANKAIADNYFMVQKLALNGQTNLDLSFTLYGNGVVYKDGDIVLEMSADGSAWTKVNFTTGAISGSDWKMGTASVTLKNAGEHLYIRFSSATTGGVRMDDVTLVAGNGGTEVDLSGSGSTTPEEPTPDTPTDATATDINALIGMMGSSTVTLDKDYTLEAVVLSDVTGGNYTGNNLVLQTEGSTTAKNGVVLFGSQVDPVTLGLNRGDKVKVTLLKDKAQLKIYNDLYEITGDKDATWCSVEKIGTGTVAPTVITVSQMKDFQSMLVTIKDVTISAADTWCTADAAGNHTFTAGGSNLTVYVKKAAAAFADKEFKATTGDMTGIVTMYNGAVQLAPRDLADVAAFMEGGTTPDTPDTPTDTALSVKELVQMMIAGTAYTEKTVEGYVAAFAPTGADNMSQGTLILTDNDGAEYSGLTIYNYALSSLSLKVGDKVKIALTSGTTDNYNGLRQIKNIPADAVTVLSSGATIQYKTLTGAQLVADYEKYLSVPVQVLQAKPTAESVGKNFNTTLTFNDGTDFTVYGRSKWTAGSELTVADKTGTIRGILSTYNNPQLVPASTADVEPFIGTTTPDEGGDEPDPTPDPEPELDPSGDVYFWKDDFSFCNSETGDSNADLGANLKGSLDGFTDSYQSVVKIYAAAAGKVKGGTGSVKGTLTTPAMKNVSGTAEATLSVDLAAWVGSAGADATKMVIKVNNGGTIDGAASVTTEQLTAEMKTYTFNLAGITSATTITIEAGAASKKRFYLDNLIIKQK